MAIGVYDFFSGCGGTSAGLRSAGFRIALGVDNDSNASQTFKANFPDAEFISDDIALVEPKHITAKMYPRDDAMLFCGCAPCQPFSRQNKRRGKDDPRFNLLGYFGKFITHFLPEYIFVENVPGLQRLNADGSPLNAFTELLESLGYKVTVDKVNCLHFGIPQKRVRLVVLASRLGPISFPKKTHGPDTSNPDYATVRNAIEDLPEIQAGETDKNIPNHYASRLSVINMERIKATPVGGRREDWPDKLVLKCHQGDYDGHSDVYGRLRWDEPSITLTARCNSLSNG
ncbi:MAG: DNA cytosine methyltransferase, partial [Pedobacter sp.]